SGNIDRAGVPWAESVEYTARATRTTDVQYRVLENWGHLDVLFGTAAAHEVFLPVSEWIVRHNVTIPAGGEYLYRGACCLFFQHKKPSGCREMPTSLLLAIRNFPGNPPFFLSCSWHAHCCFSCLSSRRKLYARKTGHHLST